MSNDLPDDSPSKDGLETDPFKALDQKLNAIESRKAAQADKKDHGAEQGASRGYQVVGELMASLLGGLGVGWYVDGLMGTKPWCLIVGLLLGLGLGVYVISRPRS